MICNECPCLNRITLECGALRNDVSDYCFSGDCPDHCPLLEEGGGEDG